MTPDPKRPFPWHEAMAFGLGVLKLSPRDFWSMTPKELAAAFASVMPGAQRTAPMPRQAFAELMRRFPDS